MRIQSLFLVFGSLVLLSTSVFASGGGSCSASTDRGEYSVSFSTSRPLYSYERDRETGDTSHFRALSPRPLWVLQGEEILTKIDTKLVRGRWISDGVVLLYATQWDETINEDVVFLEIRYFGDRENPNNYFMVEVDGERLVSHTDVYCYSETGFSY